MENYVIAKRDSELYHHGTKGMKWGRRLYQNKDGSLTPLGKVRYNTNSDFKKTVDRQNNLKKAREAKVAKAQHEADKERILKSGSAKELLNYKGELTKQQRDEAWSRLQWEQNIKGAAEKEAQETKTKVDNALEKIGKLTTDAKTVIELYNTAANVNNAFNLGFMMPKIDTNISNGNRKEVKAEKKEKAKAAEAKKKREEQEAQKETKQKERAEKRAAEAGKDSKDTKKDETTSKESKKQTDEPDVEKVSGTVEGKGTSTSDIKRDWDTSKSNNTTRRTYTDDDIIDMEVSSSSISNPPAVYTSRGQSVVTGLLEELR